MMDNKTIGIDIGGSHITAAVVDMELRQMVKNSCIRETVNSKGSADEIISTWSETIVQACSLQQINHLQIGIAMPGPFDYENGISYIKGLDKYEALYGLNVKQLIAERLGIKPTQIKLLNDAACFLQGEAFAGAGKGFKKIIGLTLGTGAGTARYSDNLAQDAELWCSPFLDSITEDYLSTKWFLKRYTELTGLTISNVKELADKYDTSPVVLAIFEEFAHNLALFISQFISTDEPQAVIIGGNISKAANRFLPYVEKYLAVNNIKTPVYKALLNEEAAILGAAALWLNHSHSYQKI